MADYGEREKWRWWEIMELMKQVSRKEIESQTKRNTQVQCLHLCDFNLLVWENIWLLTSIYIHGLGGICQLLFVFFIG